MSIDFAKQRKEMVEKDLRKNGIKDERVLEAMGKVPREEFVDEWYKDCAYLDVPLPIGLGQTISQPYVVAVMCEALGLKGIEKVLDVGAGSGYQAAVLSLLVREVVAIERIEKLASRAAEVLSRLGYANVKVVCGNASGGYMEEVPYDAIVSAAAMRRVPEAWLEQLRGDGRIVYPEEANGQELVKLTKRKGKISEERLGVVSFVPFVEPE